MHNKTHDLYEAKFIAEMLIDNKRDKVIMRLLQFFKLKIEVLNEESQMFDENYKVR